MSFDAETEEPGPPDPLDQVVQSPAACIKALTTLVQERSRYHEQIAIRHLGRHQMRVDSCGGTLIMGLSDNETLGYWVNQIADFLNKTVEHFDTTPPFALHAQWNEYDPT